MTQETKSLLFQRNVFTWIGAATGALLLIPLIAMQFTAEVNWGLADFVIMGALLFGLASMFVLIARRLPRPRRALTGIVFVVAFLYIWAELGVGVFTDLGS
mgnify:CR=1 FL=1